MKNSNLSKKSPRARPHAQHRYESTPATRPCISLETATFVADRSDHGDRKIVVAVLAVVFFPVTIIVLAARCGQHLTPQQRAALYLSSTPFR